jgi:pyroglutamyl-peptidase
MQRFLWVMMMTAASAVLTPASFAAEPVEKLPVILITGFEPFGDGRPPNPSWEGAKRLDGVEWRGHRIVARQLPVVWGAPLAHLKKWNEELHPVAIFSFGQGGGYAIETLARNTRGRGKDNRGDLPPLEKIATGSTAELQASIDSAKMAKLLAKRGHKVALSRDAGQYLCEECLYSLEDLKASQKLDATVMFCHLPPLNKRYAPADVEAFMRDVLACWTELTP